MSPGAAGNQGNEREYDMDYYEANEAIKNARDVVSKGDTIVRQTASLLLGRMRRADIPRWILKALKKELQNFNAHTGEWMR